RELRERLNDLAAVAEPEKKGGLRVPPLAASWLDDLLTGTSAEMDGGFRDRIKQLQAAQGLRSELPTDLQATLRPYQEEGYLWAMRLAEAGFGACLADDMGLGNTTYLLAKGRFAVEAVIQRTDQHVLKTRHYGCCLRF
ncbi:hypothetical protein, partial [Acidithiobacillus sp. RW2]|nr:hypothetical protein [Acidithiobacillus sulfurivorans]